MVTIVIPTHNRPIFLKRLLLYLTSVNTPYLILIADSSIPKIIEQNKHVVVSLKNQLNMCYKKYDFNISATRKFQQIISEVITKYAVLCADDDFLIPNGVEQCVDFLERHPDYSVASGRSISLRFFDLQNEFISSFEKPCVIDAETPQIRLFKHYSNYNHTFYAVHRSSELLNNLNHASKKPLPARLTELMLSGCSLIQGKAKCLDILYMVRQSTQSAEAYMGMSGILSSNDFPQFYEYFCNTLSHELLKKENDLTLLEAKQAIDQSFHAYLKFAKKIPLNKRKNLFLLLKRKSKRIWRQIYYKMRILPDLFYTIIFQRKLIHLIRSPKKVYHELQEVRKSMQQEKQELRYLTEFKIKHQHNEGCLERLLDEKSLFYQDFLPVHKYITQYPTDQISMSLNRIKNSGVSDPIWNSRKVS